MSPATLWRLNPESCESEEPSLRLPDASRCHLHPKPRAEGQRARKPGWEETEGAQPETTKAGAPRCQHPSNTSWRPDLLRPGVPSPRTHPLNSTTRFLPSCVLAIRSAQACVRPQHPATVPWRPPHCPPISLSVSAPSGLGLQAPCPSFPITGPLCLIVSVGASPSPEHSAWGHTPWSTHWLLFSRSHVLGPPTPDHRASESSLSLDPAPAPPAPSYRAPGSPLSGDPARRSPKPHALRPQQQATPPQTPPPCGPSIRPSRLRDSVLSTLDHSFSIQSLVPYPAPHSPSVSLEPALLRARVPGPLSCVPSTGPRLFRAPAVPGSSHRSPQARPPALLTGDWSSRCRGSRRPAPGNRAAARLLPGRGRGSRWPEPTRTSSSKPMVTAKPASFCTARPRGPGVPGAGDNQERPRRLDRSCGPRLERREPAGGGVKSGSEVEVVWGGAHASPGPPFQIQRGGLCAVKGGVGLSF